MTASMTEAMVSCGVGVRSVFLTWKSQMIKFLDDFLPLG